MFSLVRGHLAAAGMHVGSRWAASSLPRGVLSTRRGHCGVLRPLEVAGEGEVLSSCPEQTPVLSVGHCADQLCPGHVPRATLATEHNDKTWIPTRGTCRGHGQSVPHARGPQAARAREPGPATPVWPWHP